LYVTAVIGVERECVCGGKVLSNQPTPRSLTLLVTDFATLTVSISDKDNAISSLNSQISSLQGQVSSLQAQYNTNVFYLSGNETLLNQTRMWLEGNITYYNSQIADLQNQLNAFTNKVLFVTSIGNITIQLFDDMPITVGNFRNLVRSGAYNGTIFHRVVPGFVIQGGDLRSKGINWSTIQDENIGLHSNLRGTVAMAKTSQPNSATSQFYINLNDSNAGPSASLDSNYSVFGQVISGMDNVDAISQVQINTSTNQPLQDVTLISAKFTS